MKKWLVSENFYLKPSSPWVSSLPLPPACIMGATRHILTSKKKKKLRRVRAHAIHSFILASAKAHASMRMLMSFTCQVHLLPLFEHHVTAGASSTWWVVVFPSCLRNTSANEHKEFHTYIYKLHLHFEQATASICFLLIGPHSVKTLQPVAVSCNNHMQTTTRSSPTIIRVNIPVGQSHEKKCVCVYVWVWNRQRGFCWRTRGRETCS